MSERAYTLLHVKALDSTTRRFSGLASTPELDRQGHVIDMAGARFANPLPLLLFHDQTSPIGTARLKRGPDGLEFDATLPNIDTPGRLKDRIDEAWDSITAGLITGVSIGFRPLGDAVEVVKGGLKFLKTEIFELSLVTIPANASASILTVKSLAATGRHSPCVAGSVPRTPMKQTTAEHIASLRATHATKTGRMAEIMATGAEDGTTLDDANAKEYDTLALEVKSLEADIERLKTLQAAQVSAASPIVLQTGAPSASVPLIQVGKKQLPPGTAFTRGVMAIAASKGNKLQAVEIAKQWKDTPEVELWMKAAVAPGTTTDPQWAGALVHIQNLTNEFIELLRPATILGKIPGFRRVPFNVSVPIQTAGGTYGWVGQGAPKPVTKLTFGTDQLLVTKCAGIIVLTQELVRFSDPSAEGIVRGDMVAGIAQFLDQQFIDPAIAAGAANPASVTNGTTAIVSTGDPLKDIHALMSWFAAANIPLTGVTLIMSETNAFTIGMQRDPLGNRRFPNMSVSGGTVDGINIVTSNTAGSNVIALVPSFILYADDGGVNIDVSTEASVQMDSAPMNPADATTVYRSFWQDNLVGLRAERYINWKRVKLEAVKYVSGATYVPTVGGVTLPAAEQSAA